MNRILLIVIGAIFIAAAIGAVLLYDSNGACSPFMNRIGDFKCTGVNTGTVDYECAEHEASEQRLDYVSGEDQVILTRTDFFSNDEAALCIPLGDSEEPRIEDPLPQFGEIRSHSYEDDGIMRHTFSYKLENSLFTIEYIQTGEPIDLGMFAQSLMDLNEERGSDLARGAGEVAESDSSSRDISITPADSSI